jgi:hypothetical protein
VIWIVGFPLAVLVIAIHDRMSDHSNVFANDWGTQAMGVVLCLLFMFIAALAGGGLAALIGAGFASHPEEISKKELVALRDKDGVEGRFFLGSGSVEGAPYYFYYSKLNGGGFKPGKVKVSDGVRVYEDADDGTATLVSYQWDIDLSWAWLIAIPVNSGGYSYDFHVPKGTIRTGFTM